MYDDYTMAKTIKEMGKPSKVILLLRSQYSIIPSLYSYIYIKMGGTMSYKAFIRHVAENDKCNYYKMVETFYQYFSPDDIKVMLFEDFIQDKHAFLKELFRFVGLEPPSREQLAQTKQHKRPRYPLLVSKGALLFNRLMPFANARFRWWTRLFLYRINGCNERLGLLKFEPLDKNVYYRKCIQRGYHESNAKLFALLDYDQKAYEYP